MSEPPIPPIDYLLGRNFLQLGSQINARIPPDEVNSLRTPRRIILYHHRPITHKHVQAPLIHLQDLALRIRPSEAAHHDFFLLVRLEKLTSGVECGLLVDPIREVGVGPVARICRKGLAVGDADVRGSRGGEEVVGQTSGKGLLGQLGRSSADGKLTAPFGDLPHPTVNS